MKHIRRVLGDSTLTYEKMATLTQVEACLNSRPMQALTDDLDDVAALTPGHFLIGSALNVVPEKSLLETSTSTVSRWQLIQRCETAFGIGGHGSICKGSCNAQSGARL